MEGWKTLITNAIVVFVALAAMFGIVIDIDDTTAITAGVLAVINIVLRFKTTGPVALLR